jgi:PAS domain S-box-containing protein
MVTEEQNKKTELLLKDLTSLESYIHDLFSFSPLPICFISPSNIILELNPAFEKISNYGFEELVGEPITKLLEEKEMEELSRNILKGRTIQDKEMKLFPKDKEPLFVQVFAKARRNEKGRIVGFFLGLFDLTNIKKSEEELRKTQSALLNILEDSEEARRRAEAEKEKTEAIIANLSDGLMVFDQELRLVLINPKVEQFFDVTKRDVFGKRLDELMVLSSLRPLVKLLKAKTRIFRKELILGDDLILEVSTITLEKQIEGLSFLVVVHDVTREKIVERLKTEFVSISAHQLRTPLSAIKWTLRMLLDGDLGQITEEQREFLARTYRSNERMIDLVNSLLNVTRIEEGRFLYHRILKDMVTIVEEVLVQFENEIKKKKIKLVFKKPLRPLPRVLVDTDKIKLVVENLIDNAVKYTLEKGKIVITLKKLNKEIEFCIKDNGVGIPSDQNGRVFTKFFRGANVMKLETEGSGLGLFIAKNIIEAHGGKIWFKSKQNKGTTFWFTLPIAE